jgi:hypothetical protein
MSTNAPQETLKRNLAGRVSLGAPSANRRTLTQQMDRSSMYVGFPGRPLATCGPSSRKAQRLAAYGQHGQTIRRARAPAHVAVRCRSRAGTGRDRSRAYRQACTHYSVVVLKVSSHSTCCCCSAPRLSDEGLVSRHESRIVGGHRLPNQLTHPVKQKEKARARRRAARGSSIHIND